MKFLIWKKSISIWNEFWKYMKMWNAKCIEALMMNNDFDVYCTKFSM